MEVIFKKYGFSLAEMMLVMLIITVIMAAAAPIITKRAKIQNEIQQANSTPIGAIMPYAGSTAPSGWLFCNGQAISRTGDYAGLFSAINTTYGAGNGTTTFNVPDLRGIFIRGAGTSGKYKDYNGNYYSSNLGTYQYDAIKNIWGHFFGRSLGSSDGGFTTTYYTAGQGYWGGVNNDPIYYITFDASLITRTTSSETRPANLALNHIIKY